MPNIEGHGYQRRAPLAVRFLDWCSNAMMHLTELLLFFIMCIVTYEVVARYIFKSPTIWVTDVSRYCLVYMTFLSASSLLLKGEHINVDLIVTHVPRRVQLAIFMAGHLLCAGTFLVLCYYSALTTWDIFSRGVLVMDPIEIPKYVPLVIIPIGSFFLLMAAVARIREFVMDWRRLTEGGAK